ncbi:hypothetical protein ILYODFUR_032596 [Ilyodon furcidens]|uniref:Uncharacterized protein n=1 Tax=Ilyodon furcidens TaxID=33524 RepID=A0ABV0SR19_9TELE
MHWENMQTPCRKTLRPGVEPRTFLLQGNSVTNCAIMQPTDHLTSFRQKMNFFFWCLLDVGKKLKVSITATIWCRVWCIINELVCLYILYNQILLNRFIFFII